LYVDTVLEGTTYNLDSILGNEADFWEDGLDLENPKVRMGEETDELFAGVATVAELGEGDESLVTQTGNDDGVETERTEFAAVRRLGGRAEGSADLERSTGAKISEIMENGRAADRAAGIENYLRLRVKVVDCLGAYDKLGVMLLRRRRLRVLSEIRECRYACGSRRAAGSRRPDRGASRVDVRETWMGSDRDSLIALKLCGGDVIPTKLR
jgi:hypothetical protein